MNRRSFLKRLGLLVAVPFVPISAVKHLIPNSDVQYKCYRSNAKTLGELLSQIKAVQKQGLLQSPYPIKGSKVYGIVSVKSRYWDKIQLEIQPAFRFFDVKLNEDGFENFIARRVPIVKRG